MNSESTTKGKQGRAGFTNFLSLLRKVRFSSVESGLLFLGGATIFFCMLLTLAEVVGRYGFNHPITGTVEITQLSLALIVYLSVAAAEREGAHISMGLFPELMKRRERLLTYHTLEIFNYVVPFCAFAIVSYLFVINAHTAYLTHETSWGPLYLKHWPFKIAVFLGFALLTVRLAIRVTTHVRAFQERRRPKSEN